MMLRYLAQIKLPRPVASTANVRERARRKNRRNIRDISRIFPRTLGWFEQNRSRFDAANGPVARPQLATLFVPDALAEIIHR